MTRGQIAIIKNDYSGSNPTVLTSIEFNGDMYIRSPGHGKKIITVLEKRVYDAATYMYEVAKFNKENHHYNDIERLTYDMDISTLDFTKDYFDNWFSDYVYIKNLTKQTFRVKSAIRNEDGDDIGVLTTDFEPNAIMVLCFGRLEKLILPEE